MLAITPVALTVGVTRVILKVAGVGSVGSVLTTRPSADHFA
jgi:hypothetical protein